MNDAFAAFLHALPTILGAGMILIGVYGFWRGLSLRPKDSDERAPDPMSPSQYLDGPWDPAPRWLRRLFGRRD